MTAPDAHDLMIAALTQANAGDHRAARALFDRALALEPDNPGVLTGLAIWHRQQGALREAVLACDAAIRIAPGYADAWTERGTVLSGGGSVKAAVESFTHAVRLAPHNPIAFAGLASQLFLDGKPTGAEQAARQALALDPSNLLAAATLGGVLVDRGESEQAVRLLAPLVERAPTSNDRAIAANWLARASERLGDYDGAFACYALGKADFAQVHASAGSGRPTQTQFVEAVADAVDEIGGTAFVGQEPDSTIGAISPHIFLMGYPRSGTTLVENVLASLPGVAASEEWPTFGDADHRFLAGDATAISAGLRAFAALDQSGRDAVRAAYWRQAVAAGVPRDASAFVDMDPIKATRLPLIARLFPDARVLIMRRDPRDVVWSCFKTSFAMTSNTLEYTSLERTARHYDAMMRLTDLALATLPLTAMEVQYRALVREFEATTKAICAFAGLPWSENVGRFDRTAERRGVGTASATQVRKGLYDGSGQWRPYARWLEPVLPILAPWIERFGDD